MLRRLLLPLAVFQGTGAAGNHPEVNDEQDAWRVRFPHVTRQSVAGWLTAASVIALLGLSQVPSAGAAEVLFESFENGTLDPRISLVTVGGFVSSPGIKPAAQLGSVSAFGFGRSNCRFNCFGGHVTNLRITFPEPTFVSLISFKEMELFDNWGSGGAVYIDGQPLAGSGFGRAPYNDRQADATFRTARLTVDREVSEVVLHVEDITDLSEIYLDDLEVLGDISTLSVTRVTPSSGGNNGRVTAFIRGSGFDANATVKLVRAGQPDAVAEAVSFGVDGLTATATFDLEGRALGPWSVVVVNPDSSSANIPDGFTIEEGVHADVWADVIVRSAIRAGRPERLYITYGNRGNVDAVPASIFIRGLPPGSEVTPSFEYVTRDGVSGPLPPNSPPIWSTSNGVVIPLQLFGIPAGSVHTLPFTLTVPNTGTMTLSVTVAGETR